MVASFRLFSVLALAFSTIAVPLEKRYDGPGIILTNKGSQAQTLYFYNNKRNGNGEADPSYGDDHLPNPPTVQPGETTFVSLDKSFKGRVQRGTTLPATFVEFQLSADNDGAAHGDVSLQQGCDGAATIRSPTTGQTGGFWADLVTGAPDDAYARKTSAAWGDGSVILKDGKKAIGGTMGNWDSQPNNAAVDWYVSKGLDPSKVYFHNGVKGPSGSGTDDISSANNQFEVTFF
jgi:hypothetical protein